MEIALTAFMSNVGFTFAEILKMIMLVVFSFVFQGFIIWRVRKPLKALYDTVLLAMESVPKLEGSVANLNKTMQEHVIQIDLRIDSVVEEVSILKKTISNNANR